MAEYSTIWPNKDILMAPLLWSAHTLPFLFLIFQNNFIWVQTEFQIGAQILILMEHEFNEKWQGVDIITSPRLSRFTSNISKQTIRVLEDWRVGMYLSCHKASCSEPFPYDLFGTIMVKKHLQLKIHLSDYFIEFAQDSRYFHIFQSFFQNWSKYQICHKICKVIVDSLRFKRLKLS